MSKQHSHQHTVMRSCLLQSVLILITILFTVNVNAESQIAYQPALVPGTLLPAGTPLTVNSQDVQNPLILQMLSQLGQWIMNDFVPAKTSSNEKIYIPKDSFTTPPFEGEKTVALTKPVQSYKEGTREVAASPSENDRAYALEEATQKHKAITGNKGECDFAPKPASKGMDWDAYVKKFEEMASKSDINPKAIAKTAGFLRNATGAQISKIKNRRYVTISDMTMRSRDKRMAVLDLQTGKVLHFRVSHGVGSGEGDVLKSCSGGGNSNQTPPGFHVVNNPYTGKYGDSLSMAGLESRNSSSQARHIVMHSRDTEEFSEYAIKGLGRISTSQGCPMMTQEDYHEIRNLVKGGSLYYNFCPEDR